MWPEISSLYCRFLTAGFVVLREAVSARDLEWVTAEVELLHNVPSLIAETNFARHEYFWSQERRHYIEWVSSPERQWQKSRMMTYYEPIWQEMERLISTRGNGT